MPRARRAGIEQIQEFRSEHRTAKHACKRSTQLQPRVALVTGSTSGIGRGIARALAGAGAAIVLNGFGDRAEIA